MRLVTANLGDVNRICRDAFRWPFTDTRLWQERLGNNQPCFTDTQPRVFTLHAWRCATLPTKVRRYHNYRVIRRVRLHEPVALAEASHLNVDGRQKCGNLVVASQVRHHEVGRRDRNLNVCVRAPIPCDVTVCSGCYTHPRIRGVCVRGVVLRLYKVLLDCHKNMLATVFIEQHTVPVVPLTVTNITAIAVS